MTESFEQHLVRFPLYPLRALIERRRGLSEFKAAEPEVELARSCESFLFQFEMAEEDSPYR